MRGMSKVTGDHEEIRRWAEARKGRPAVVSGTGTLRIDFPGYHGEDTLQEISWDEFSRIFDENSLAFVYQDRTASGRISRFGKFVDSDKVDEFLSGRAKRRTGTRRRKAA
jgi:hypothetical protein